MAWTCFWLKLVELKRSVELRLIWTSGTCLEMKTFLFFIYIMEAYPQKEIHTNLSHLTSLHWIFI